MKRSWFLTLTLAILVVLALTIGGRAIWTAARVRASGLRPLASLATSPDAREQTVARLVAAELVKTGDRPADFVVEFHPDSAAPSVWVVDVVSRRDFAPRYRFTVGNPTGRDREMWVDLRAQQVIRVGLFQ